MCFSKVASLRKGRTSHQDSAPPAFWPGPIPRASDISGWDSQYPSVRWVPQITKEAFPDIEGKTKQRVLITAANIIHLRVT